jgi:hypothetical protein
MKKALVLFLLFVSLDAALFAQEQPQKSESSSDYRIGEDGKIRQKISWNRVNVYFYEIEIEKQVDGNWIPELKERTEDISIEISLSPGMYRYRINNYSLLGRITVSSEWEGIRVFAAKRPAAETYSPASYHIDSNLDRFTLTIYGRDLVEGAALYLAARSGNDRPIEPLEVRYSPDESRIDMVVPTAGLTLGPYDITITNPGGLEQKVEGFGVDFKRKFDLMLSAGYLPFIPLDGYLFERYDSPVYPLGFYGQCSFLPIKQMWGSFGLEFSASWSFLRTENTIYTLNGQMIVLDMDIIYQLWFNNWTMAVKAKAGGGLTEVYNIQFMHKDGSGAESEQKGTMLLNVNAGVSFEWILWRDFFVEAGLDYVQCFSTPTPIPGFVRISAGAGWKF